MTTQYTSILKLALPVQGELSGTWGDVVNDNITSMVEQAIAGRAVIDSWTANAHTLTTANGVTSESRCAMLEFTDSGTQLTGAGSVVCPTLSKIYIAKNASGQNVTLKTSGGTGILVPSGRTMFLFCDGTNVVEAVTSTTSLQLGTSTTVTAVLDEDNMASNSAVSLATQQSIKAYVDAQVATSDTLAEVLANGNTTGGTDVSVSTDDKVQFRDAAIYINSSADGQLDIVADTEIQLAATTIDVNGILDVSGNIVAGGTVDGRDVATDGTKLDGIEASADVTDTTNVTAAGALMDSEVTNLAQVKAFDSADYATAAQGTTADAALPKAGGAMTGAITTNSTFDGRDVATDGTKLDGIEASADVTDTTNVTAAGALMDSEVTNLAQVKAFDSSDYATAAQGTTADAALPKAGGAMTGAITTNSTFDGRDVATDGTKLDGIEANADVTDTTNVTAAGALMDSEVDADIKTLSVPANTTISDYGKTLVDDADAAAARTTLGLGTAATTAATDYATAAQGTTADAALPKAGGAMTGAITTNSTFDGRDVATDGTKLDGIEASADVTDATNVTAAGALMDSELTAIASVKALNQGVATTDSPTFTNLTLSGTDSVKVPSGTTGQRNGSPANGMFRYNSTTAEFEGYQDGAWGSIGGGSADITLNQFTGDGSDTTFTLSGLAAENNTFVYIDGVYQSKDNYTVSAADPAVLTFSTAPPNTTAIEVMSAAISVSNIGTPSDNTVSTAKIVDGAVTTAKLASTLSIQDLTLTGTGAVKMPTGTTAQRPTGVAGQLRYNSTTGGFEGYTDAWGSVGSDITDYITTTPTLSSSANNEITVTNHSAYTSPTYIVTIGETVLVTSASGGTITIEGNYETTGSTAVSVQAEEDGKLRSAKEEVNVTLNAVYRYYRLTGMVGGAYPMIVRFILYKQANGSSPLALPDDAFSASVSYGTFYDAWRANNTALIHGWWNRDGTKVDEWLQIDTGFPMSIKSVGIQTNANNTYGLYSTEIEASVDGITWTTLTNYSFSPAYADTLQTVNV